MYKKIVYHIEHNISKCTTLFITCTNAYQCLSYTSIIHKIILDPAIPFTSKPMKTYYLHSGEMSTKEYRPNIRRGQEDEGESIKQRGLQRERLVHVKEDQAERM